MNIIHFFHLISGLKKNNGFKMKEQVVLFLYFKTECVEALGNIQICVRKERFL